MATAVASQKRPFLALPFLLPSLCESVTLGSRRNQSSYRRTKARLRVKPDASFGQSPKQSEDHIIYNPPPSAPSAFQTPTKFLPPDDIRKSLRTDASSGNQQDAGVLPTVYKKPGQKQYHLKPADIAEIRKLRLSDPMLWSRWKLAKRFECSPMFIAMVCEAGPEKRQIQRKVLEAVQSRWGVSRRMAREDRQLRKETWGRE
jgi:hypothetical protein